MRGLGLGWELGLTVRVSGYRYAVVGPLEEESVHGSLVRLRQLRER